MRAVGTLLFCLICWLFSVNVGAQETSCDNTFVTRSDATIEIAPSGADDTDNIQCAFDEATANNLANVTLIAGDYSLSQQIFAEGFEGTFSGRTTNTTVVHVEERSVACGVDGVEGIFEFSRGNAQVKSMEIRTGRPCATGDFYAVIYFTAAIDDCQARTVFGSVNRVRLVGPSEDIDRAVGVMIQEERACPPDLRLLGTLKVNRSEITGFPTGVIVSLTGAGQVDVNFNEFAENALAILIIDPNTNTTITGNSISYNDLRLAEPIFSEGIGVITVSPDAPSQNRLVIHSNRFIDGGLLDESFAIEVFLVGSATRTNHSLVISNNNFTLASPLGIAVWATDVDNGIFSNNTLKGEIDVGVLVDSFSFAQPVEDWSIVGNRFNSSGIFADIFFGFDITNSIIGPQPATYYLGSPGNWVLGVGPQPVSVSSATSTSHPTISRQSPERTLLESRLRSLHR